jgi:hypothetical protein
MMSLTRPMYLRGPDRVDPARRLHSPTPSTSSGQALRDARDGAPRFLRQSAKKQIPRAFFIPDALPSSGEGCCSGGVGFPSSFCVEPPHRPRALLRADLAKYLGFRPVIVRPGIHLRWRPTFMRVSAACATRSPFFFDAGVGCF